MATVFTGQKNNTMAHNEYVHEDKVAPSGVFEDKLDPHIRDDHGDPHRAALEDIDPDVKVNRSTWAAVFFLGFTFQPSLNFTMYCGFPILVPIALELQGNTHNLGWMSSGWSLGGSIAFAIAGQLSDYIGRRQVLMFGQCLLVIGHIICATARSMDQAIAGMVVLGFGCGTTFVLYPGISELLPNRYRSLGLAWTELNLLPFSTFGPLIGRTLTTTATWRWVYYLGIITAVISLIGTGVFYVPPLRPIRDRKRRELLAELDFFGIFLYSTGLVLFLLGLNWGGVTYPWNNAAVLAPLVIGAVTFCCTFVWDFIGEPKRALFPKRMFKNKFREYTSLIAFIFVVGFVYFSTTVLLPMQISYMWSSDPIRAGLYNIPSGFAGAGGGVILGGLIYKMKHVQYQLFTGIAVQTVFTALMSLITPDRIAMGLVFQFFSCFPFAWITLACYITAGLHISQRDIGLALGLLGTFRFIGGSIGIMVFTTIVSNKAATALPKHVMAAVAPLGYPTSQIPDLIAAISSGTTATLTGTSPEVIQVASKAMQWGYGEAFRIAWLVSIPFGIIACALALFVIDPSPYFTTHVAVTLEKERLGGGHKGLDEVKTIDHDA